MRIQYQLGKYIREDGAQVSEELWAYLMPSAPKDMRYDIREGNESAIAIYFAHCLGYKLSGLQPKRV